MNFEPLLQAVSFPVAMALLALVAVVCTAIFGVAKGVAASSTLVAIGFAIVIASNFSPGILIVLSFMLPFALAVVAVAIGLGVAAGASLRKRNYWLALLCLSPFAFFIGYTTLTAKLTSDERKLAKAFVDQNSRLQLLVGGRLNVNQVSSTEYSDWTKGKYEFTIPNPASVDSRDQSLYVIVAVKRGFSGSVFKLACVTSLSSGGRDMRSGDCGNGVVQLPEVNFANEDHQKILAKVANENAKCEFQNLRLPPSFTVQAVEAHSGVDVEYPIDKSGQAATQINVTVNSPGKPIVLVLNAHDPNIWNISWTQGTEIPAVLVIGKYRQVVAGLSPKTPVLLNTVFPKGEQETCHDFSVPRERRDLLNAMSLRLFGRAVESVSNAPDGKVVIGLPMWAATPLVTSPETPPASYFDKSSPRVRKAGLADALSAGLLRRTTVADSQAWVDAWKKFSLQERQSIGGSEPQSLRNQPTTGGYVVLGPFVYPAGLHGGYSTNFIIPKGVEKPKGDRGHSIVFDFNTMQCEGC